MQTVCPGCSDEMLYADNDIVLISDTMEGDLAKLSSWNKAIPYLLE